MTQRKYGYEVPRKNYPISNSDDEDTLYNGKCYKELIMPTFFRQANKN